MNWAAKQGFIRAGNFSLTRLGKVAICLADIYVNRSAGDRYLRRIKHE